MPSTPLDERTVAHAVAVLSLPDSTSRALVSGRASLWLRTTILGLLELKPLPLDDHKRLRAAGFAVASARGYELAFERDRAPNKAAGAAGSWRAARLYSRALTIASIALDQDPPPADRAVLLTTVAACLADLRDFEGARAAGLEALSVADPRQRDAPQRVLGRIATLVRRSKEASARFADANAVVEHRLAVAAALEDGSVAAFCRLLEVPAEAREYTQFRRAREAAQRLYREDYLRSEHWLSVRERVRKRANGMCEACRVVDAELDVHHTTYWRRGFEDADVDLVALCRPCHASEHDFAEQARRAVAAAIKIGPPG